MLRSGDKITADGGRGGTLGGVLRPEDASDPRRFAMTCSHVLSSDGRPNPGLVVVDATGQEIGQCVQGSDRWNDGLDMALIALSVDSDPAVVGIGAPGSTTEPDDVGIGGEVRGRGAGSAAVQASRIVAIDQAVSIPDGRAGQDAPYPLADQVLLAPAFQRGDSGTWVVDGNRFIVGMLIGSDRDNQHEVVTPIGPLVDKASEWANVQLVPFTVTVNFAAADAPTAAAPPASVPQAGTTGGQPTVSGFPSPREAIGQAIDAHEGGWSDIATDSGNWAHCRDGSTKLVGTMRGITVDAYAHFKSIDPCTVSAATLQALTLDEAVDIALQDYFVAPGFDRLLWCPVMDSVFDAALMSGPARAIRLLQQLIDANVDGGVGPQTIEALDMFMETNAAGDACNRYSDLRIEFYTSISAPGTKNSQFRNGWIKRANAFRTGTAWWSRWQNWIMPHPAGSSSATGVRTTV